MKEEGCAQRSTPPEMPVGKNLTRQIPSSVSSIKRLRIPDPGRRQPISRKAICVLCPSLSASRNRRLYNSDSPTPTTEAVMAKKAKKAKAAKKAKKAKKRRKK